MIAFANPGAPPLVPEIDPGSIGTALAFGSAVVLMARRAKR